MLVFTWFSVTESLQEKNIAFGVTDTTVCKLG